MADKYHASTQVVLTSGAAFTWTHGLTANGSPVAPDQVTADFVHGTSIGVNNIRCTSKGTDVCSVVLDQPTSPDGQPNAVTTRLDAVYWHSGFGR